MEKIFSESVSDMDLVDVMNDLESLIDSLAFLREEWVGADSLLTSRGFPAHIEDEFGDKEFVPLEKRIKEALDNG